MNPIIPPRSEAKAEARNAIRRDLTLRYAEQRKHSGLWRRLVIRVRMEREVAAELKRRFPPQALFATSGSDPA